MNHGSETPDLSAASSELINDTLARATLPALLESAERITLAGHGRLVGYSRKVFIPLTKLCRNVCHYCGFAESPGSVQAVYLGIEDALEIARRGAAHGCKEALFTLGDKPELRHPVARQALDRMGYATTVDYLAAVARRVFEETGLLPHLNPGVMSAAEIAALRPVGVSMGLMLETLSDDLSQPGSAHHGSPDKQPALRLASIDSAGLLSVPFTTGLLIGIGETRAERIEALLAIRELHRRHGHIQEVIIQNFRAKPGTLMAQSSEPPLEEQLWTIAVARLLLGSEMTLQAPPNLRPGALPELLRAGVNDWGGISPLTPDHVNPEAPWPHIDSLRRETERAGRELVERLAIAPRFAQDCERWVDSALRAAVRRNCDATGLARTDAWQAGGGIAVPAEAALWFSARVAGAAAPTSTAHLLQRAERGDALSEAEIVSLFAARGDELVAVFTAADGLRREVCGDAVTYVVNRNINYTNICTHKCGFCAFCKGRGSEDLRGPAYRLDVDQIAGLTLEAHAAGATEVCLQGGIHPAYTGQSYLEIVAAVKAAVPGMHIHAFSPLEISHGARTLGLSLRDYLRRLMQAGLSSLPGTAAEILDDEVRALICPDKIDTAQWFDVMRTAHGLGLRSTATIMFGHVEHPRHWARHLLQLRALQQETGGFSEFVALPFVHMEAPMYRRGLTRRGPSLREAVLMHAIARLVLHPWIGNIQTSWVKLGADGAGLCLRAGANDLGGTLMNESITRAAGGIHGEALGPEQIEAVIASVGRPARRRTTLYGQVEAQTPSAQARAERPPPGAGAQGSLAARAFESLLK